jgi:hypothetical protein
MTLYTLHQSEDMSQVGVILLSPIEPDHLERKVSKYG